MAKHTRRDRRSGKKHRRRNRSRRAGGLLGMKQGLTNRLSLGKSKPLLSLPKPKPIVKPVVPSSTPLLSQPQPSKPLLSEIQPSKPSLGKKSVAEHMKNVQEHAKEVGNVIAQHASKATGWLSGLFNTKDDKETFEEKSQPTTSSMTGGRKSRRNRRSKSRHSRRSRHSKSKRSRRNRRRR